MTSCIAVTDLKHSYNGLVAVDGVDFSVEPGEIFGLLGPNGAGKSTTTEILVGLKKRKSGSVNVLGLDPSDNRPELKKRIGVQLQTPALFERLKVSELLTLFASFYPNPLNIDDVIAMVGLEEKRSTITKKLSGGQLQRVSVALALISNGDIVFLDEPTTGLDPQSRRSMWEAIKQIKAQGRTVFLTTHYMEEAERLCDHVAIIDHGKIIAYGTPVDLINSNFEDEALEFEVTKGQNKLLEKELTDITKIEFHEDRATVYTRKVARTVTQLLNLASQGFELKSFTVRRATLEDVFIKLTGRRIRE